MVLVGIFGIENDGVNTAVNVLLLVLVVVWLALIFWTFADARRRIDDPMLVALRDRGVPVPVRGHDRVPDRAPAGVRRRRAPARAGDDRRRGAARAARLPAVPALRLRDQGRLPACAGGGATMASASSSETSPAGRQGSMRASKQPSAFHRLPMPAIVRWSSRASPIGRVGSSSRRRRRKRSVVELGREDVGPERGEALVEARARLRHQLEHRAVELHDLRPPRRSTSQAARAERGQRRPSRARATSPSCAGASGSSGRPRSAGTGACRGRRPPSPPGRRAAPASGRGRSAGAAWRARPARGPRAPGGCGSPRSGSCRPRALLLRVRPRSGASSARARRRRTRGKVRPAAAPAVSRAVWRTARRGRRAWPRAGPASPNSRWSEFPLPASATQRTRSPAPARPREHRAARTRRRAGERSHSARPRPTSSSESAQRRSRRAPRRRRRRTSASAPRWSGEPV